MRCATPVGPPYGDRGYLSVASPWLPDADGATVTVVSEGREEHEVSHGNRSLSGEALTVAAHAGERQAPAMSWSDSLGQRGPWMRSGRRSLGLPGTAANRPAAKEAARQQSCCAGELRPGRTVKPTCLCVSGGGGTRGSPNRPKTMRRRGGQRSTRPEETRTPRRVPRAGEDPCRAGSSSAGRGPLRWRPLAGAGGRHAIWRWAGAVPCEAPGPSTHRYGDGHTPPKRWRSPTLHERADGQRGAQHGCR